MSELQHLQNALRQLIARGELEEAIRQLLEFSDQVPYRHVHDLAAQQSAAFRHLRADKIKGILSHDEASRALNKITDSVLSIINQLGDPPPPSPGQPSWTDAQSSHSQVITGTGNIALSDIQDSQISIHIGPKGPQDADDPGQIKKPLPKTGFWEWIGRSNNLVGVIAGVITLASVFGLSSLFKPDQPLSLTVLLDNQTPNAYLPFENGKVTLIYGDKTEDKAIEKEAVFKGIPANFKKEPVIVRFEAPGFTPIDTTFPLSDNRIILPVWRDNSLGRIFGTVKDEQGSPIPGAQIAVQDLVTTSGADGHFELQIPFDKQRKSQRVKAHKPGFKPWDYESPIFQHEEISIILVRQ